MATTHLRYQLHLHGAQVKRLALLGILGLLVPTVAFGQRKSNSKASRGRGGTVKSITVKNLPAYDERWFHPGMYVGFSASRFIIEQSDRYITNRNIIANSVISPSLGVGFIGDARLGDATSPFVLRFAPGVSFLTRKVEFKPRRYPNPDSIVTQEVTSTVIQFPVLLKYQSDRRRNSRAYMIAGLSPSITASNRRSDPLRNQLQALNSDLTLEYGVGLDLFYPLFKLAPELRFSHGLRNLLVSSDRDVFSRSLQRMSTNSVTLYLNIQN
ncbi:porin family protein [Hymenobacter sp. IS2118]|uniref:type IX secretion/gliding motility protein PorT/SprT n=1 Tax=Hymenobacter sp. IS2118 TaxID=1505605 RepID=UPI0009DE76C4|nr:porin family protein [Hymenobacter sp. IS2118]